MSMIPLALAAVASFSASYDCTLSAPQALKQDAGKVSLNPINFPGVAEGAWKFHVSIIRDKSGVNADLVWPDDPIQIAGKFAGLPTADGSVAFMAYSIGPCMFTESGCMTLINLVDAGDGTAKVIITPAALASDSATKTREPFVVVIEGKCIRNGSSK